MMDAPSCMLTYAQRPESPKARRKTKSKSSEQSSNITGASRFSFDLSRISLHPDDNQPHSSAVGLGAALAPPIVHEVLSTEGQPMPANLQRQMESLLRHDFSDVRLHTDARAATSAEAVDAQAYTVGRHIAFAPGRYNPKSAQGLQLLAHELAHVASVPATMPVLFRQGNPPKIPPGGITGVSVNHDKVTVPPESGLSFKATKAPPTAAGVTLSVVGDNATIAARTTVNNTNGVISVDPTQTGGTAHIAANQSLPVPGSSPTTISVDSVVFNFIASPSSLSSSSVSPGITGKPDFYGGEFKHTFAPAAGSPAAIEFAHLNEQYAGATGKKLKLTGALGNIDVDINDPDSITDGWDLDASGKMAASDDVGWKNTIDARPFVANTSNRSSNPALPPPVTVTQNFRNLSFPSQKYGAAAVTSTTHSRSFAERNNKIKAITSAGIKAEVEDDYAGPTIFRHCRATPNSIPITAPPAPGATAPATKTSTITVDAEGQSATPTFTIQPPDLGCTITSAGVLTPGTSPGKVTVRAGDTTNFDETIVELTK